MPTKTVSADYWKERHARAYRTPRQGVERALRSIIDGLEEYARGHEAANGSKLSEDYILGEYWISAWSDVRGLLNGDIGRFDGGSLDRRLGDIATAGGFTESEQDMGSIKS